MLPIGQMIALRHLESFEEFPPMQAPPSYNLAQVHGGDSSRGSERSTTRVIPSD